jgi:hypothetical protein
MVFRGGAMQNDNWPDELERIFAAYRTVGSEPEPSADFLPGLWRKIDQRRRVTYSFRRIASGFVTAAAAICLVLSVALWTPSQSPVTGGATYVEVLADSELDSGLE